MFILNSFKYSIRRARFQKCLWILLSLFTITGSAILLAQEGPSAEEIDSIAIELGEDIQALDRILLQEALNRARPAMPDVLSISQDHPFSKDDDENVIEYDPITRQENEIWIKTHNVEEIQIADPFFGNLPSAHPASTPSQNGSLMAILLKAEYRPKQ